MDQPDQVPMPVSPSPDLNILVVDLDHSLVRTDLLAESFFSSLSRCWHIPLSALWALMRGGRPQLKRHLAERSSINYEQLPYNAEVLDLVQLWKSKGARIVLATGSDRRHAQAVADHLKVFGEVYASDGKLNLSGRRKAEFLAEHCGTERFAYVGDHRRDLPVWRQSAAAITVGAPPRLRRQVEDIPGIQVQHVKNPPAQFRAALRALRPHQWLKNFLIFVPMALGHQLTPAAGLPALQAFAAFCLIASGIYLFNDLLDLSADRSHPRKSARPFASGRLRIAHGLWLPPSLMAAGLLLAFSVNTPTGLVAAIYALLSISYSCGLKRALVLDIAALSLLYTLRIICGGAAAGIDVSLWLLAFSMFIFLALAVLKRLAELIDLYGRSEVQVPGRAYLISDRPVLSMVATASGYISILVLVLYINSPEVMLLYSHPELLWGVCLVMLYWVTRLVLLTLRGEMHDDPVVFAIRDRPSLICLAIIGALGLAGTLL